MGDFPPTLRERRRRVIPLLFLGSCCVGLGVSVVRSGTHHPHASQARQLTACTTAGVPSAVTHASTATNASAAINASSDHASVSVAPPCVPDRDLDTDTDTAARADADTAADTAADAHADSDTATDAHAQTAAEDEPGEELVVGFVVVGVALLLCFFVALLCCTGCVCSEYCLRGRLDILSTSGSQLAGTPPPPYQCRIWCGAREWLCAFPPWLQRAYHAKRRWYTLYNSWCNQPVTYSGVVGAIRAGCRGCRRGAGALLCCRPCRVKGGWDGIETEGDAGGGATAAVAAAAVAAVRAAAGGGGGGGGGQHGTSSARLKAASPLSMSQSSSESPHRVQSTRMESV